MRRLILILIAVVTLALVVFAASWKVAAHFCTHRAVESMDDLTWLQEEFNLTDAELAKERPLHEAYLPQCETFCREIARRKARLEELLAAGKLADPEVEATLMEIGEWRARCQANMLRHFRAVADAMPPAQGRRFLEVVTRLTLGAHEAIEARMAAEAQDDATPAHEHRH